MLKVFLLRKAAHSSTITLSDALLKAAKKVAAKKTAGKKVGGKSGAFDEAEHPRDKNGKFTDKGLADFHSIIAYNPKKKSIKDLKDGSVITGHAHTGNIKAIITDRALTEHFVSGNTLDGKSGFKYYKDPKTKGVYLKTDSESLMNPIEVASGFTVVGHGYAEVSVGSYLVNQDDRIFQLDKTGAFKEVGSKFQTEYTINGKKYGKYGSPGEIKAMVFAEDYRGFWSVKNSAIHPSVPRAGKVLLPKASLKDEGGGSPREYKPKYVDNTALHADAFVKFKSSFSTEAVNAGVKHEVFSAISDYAGSGYQPINDYMRGITGRHNATDWANGKRHAHSLVKFFAEHGNDMTMTLGVPLYRGVNKKLFDAIKANPKKGFADGRFISTSISPRSAQGFVGTDTTMLRIINPHGIRAFPANTSEKEIVLDPRYAMRMVGKPKKEKFGQNYDGSSTVYDVIDVELIDLSNGGKVVLAPKTKETKQKTVGAKSGYGANDLDLAYSDYLAAYQVAHKKPSAMSFTGFKVQHGKDIISGKITPEKLGGITAVAPKPKKVASPIKPAPKPSTVESAIANGKKLATGKYAVPSGVKTTVANLYYHDLGILQNSKMTYAEWAKMTGFSAPKPKKTVASNAKALKAKKEHADYLKDAKKYGIKKPLPFEAWAKFNGVKL